MLPSPALLKLSRPPVAAPMTDAPDVIDDGAAVMPPMPNSEPSSPPDGPKADCTPWPISAAALRALLAEQRVFQRLHDVELERHLFELAKKLLRGLPGALEIGDGAFAELIEGGAHLVHRRDVLLVEFVIALRELVHVLLDVVEDRVVGRLLVLDALVDPRGVQGLRAETVLRARNPVRPACPTA